MFKFYMLGTELYKIVNSSNTLIDLHFPKIQKIAIWKYCVDIN